MMRFFIPVFFLGAFTLQAQVSDTVTQQSMRNTQIWNLAAGDSITIYESRIVPYDAPGSNSALMQNLFPGRSPKSYSQTSKYVLRKEGSGYRLICYLSDRDRSPNFKFDRVMKKQKYWHFKKFSERNLSEDEVLRFCMFEQLCEAHALDKYDEGDISRSMTVIRHGSKEVCSSYRDASALDGIIRNK
jgi:hypothetical protein